MKSISVKKRFAMIVPHVRVDAALDIAEVASETIMECASTSDQTHASHSRTVLNVSAEKNAPLEFALMLYAEVKTMS